MTIAELCAAAIMHSDGTAINLLMARLGGPQTVTAFARSIGDQSFDLTGDKGGTSTPQAMQTSLQKLVLADALAKPQREQLTDWLKNNTTGNLRIRAGVPKGWIVGDKTGTGPRDGTTNDVAVIWPTHCAPLVVAIYYTQTKPHARTRPEVIASATRILVKEFARGDQCIKT
jgi:beta-lactamase class A